MITNTEIVSTQSATSEDPQIQLAEFLREHNEVEMIIPVLMGLFITSRFQLRGANALLVNLAVASISRQIFQQLKSPFTSNPKTAEKSPDYSNQEIIPGCRIVHSVPGRIRLRIDRLSQDAAFAKRLNHLLAAETIVLSHRLNPTAASLAITYEAAGLSELDLGFRLINLLNLANSDSNLETS
ncbi:MAG: HMA2 domain-containing protein [Microcystis sp.]|jgi:hypothetical protein|uniref:Metal ABC transporter ATPase n=3 Tax=Microcystis TaxID=1125 RepID=A0A552ENN8_MICAE|nr:MULTISPECIES: hypothetical protein [Microcystis]MCZ8357230.1 metal ABC transporter ATPase [Microcystis sp. LE19-388.1G]NCQ67710.1 metal ABC transporter ATPase [Microcystis aeruginosa W13-16]NCQ72193.1 metal ABC transporter ATPase [Microcystis aeruginosa W13-13]NCQ76650.1 metal ABC transporter ATPase [Microcystis aeruginosa W13-15]NCR20480.1 metal ABC transporter ATPase [Microcystis aeruginosa L111-01]NCR53375.1 metal ABC transporter ATPase [Microcystis aeruginosa L211-07]NCS23344.1 metal 